MKPIGVIRSVLKTRGEAPRQGAEGAPDAWLVVERWAARGLHRMAVGDEIRSDRAADVAEPDDADPHPSTHFGAIRIAPSSRIVSPFSIAFSTMWHASAANSPGRPRRGGNGICAASACR